MWSDEGDAWPSIVCVRLTLLTDNTVPKASVGASSTFDSP